MRLFQQAAYIQNLDAGMHQVHTQGDGIQTWVKNLPVFPHLVTEAQSINMPASSTVRYISPFISNTNQPIYAVTMRELRPFQSATTSQTVLFATTSPARLGVDNPEYAFITTLFASTTEDRALFLAQQSYKAERFSFTPPPSSATTTASTTRVSGGMALQKEGDELFAFWQGEPEKIPYYFCVQQGSYASTSERYGEHVAAQVFATATSTDTYTIASTTITQSNQYCRTKVRLDRKWQSIIWFNFLPGSTNAVVLQLQDGIYLVEIDDRSWQNVQQLYAGDYLTMIVSGGQILIQDGDIYFELLTTPIAN
jgi:hypothetical protein